MKNAILLFALALILIVAPQTVFAKDDAAGSDPPLRAAIFLQNRAGDALTKKLDLLNDLLTARLTDKGFSVLDRSLVLAKFREARDPDPQLRKKIDALAAASEGGKTASPIEDALSGASALRISQIIGADYLVVASITSLGKETRTFKGEGTQYGSDNKTFIHTMRVSLKVLEGNSGGSIYGDTVTVSERVSVGQNLIIETSDVINKLMETGSIMIADNIGSKIQGIRNTKVQTAATVEFSVNSNVEGATVELDGAVIGSTPGRFMAPPGLHQLKITKEWLSPWEKTINIFPSQVLNISLELSNEGIKRYATIERLKAELARTNMRTEMEGKERDSNIGINKEQSEADAYSKKAVADREKKKREESYDKIEGAPAPTTNIIK